MTRPPLALGHHGSIKLSRERGMWCARCRVRDLDDLTRRVARFAATRSAAQQALQEELRNRRGERAEMLRADSRFRDAAGVWKAKIVDRCEYSTADIHSH